LSNCKLAKTPVAICTKKGLFLLVAISKSPQSLIEMTLTPYPQAVQP